MTGSESTGATGKRCPSAQGAQRGAMGGGHTEASVQQEGAQVRPGHCATGEDTPGRSQLTQAGFLVRLLPREPRSPACSFCCWGA